MWPLPGQMARSSRDSCQLRPRDRVRCFATSPRWLIASSYQHCRADGGFPLIVPFMALNLSTLKTTVIQAPSDIEAFGVIEDEDEDLPWLAANQHSSFPYPSPYEAIGVVLRLDDPVFSMDRYVPVVDDPENEDPYAGAVWTIAGRGPGWTLLHGFNPAYAVCRLGAPETEAANTCPSGPVVLETTEGRFELPPGTWGEFVPPATRVLSGG